MDGISQYDALIAHWLHAGPAGDNDEYIRQAAQALWLEERHLVGLAEVIKKLLGA